MRHKILVCGGFLFTLLVTAGVLNHNLSFGYGLGDLGMALSLIIFNFLSFILYFLGNKFRMVDHFLFGVNLFFTLSAVVYYSLCLTVYRGAEYPWNGSIFIH